MKERIAFFDFDGTLTKSDTLFSFARYALGPLKFVAGLLKAVPDIALWKLGLTTNSTAKERLFGFWFRGMEQNRFKELCAGFADKVDADRNEAGRRLLHAHLERGDRIVIVSASIRDWIEPWADSQGVDRVLATEAEVSDSGCLTGRFSTPNCHGLEKVRRVEAEYGSLDRYTAYAYGDSASDRFLIEAAGRGELL